MFKPPSSRVTQTRKSHPQNLSRLFKTLRAFERCPLVMSGSTRSNRMQFMNRFPRGIRNHLVAMSGEFTGTFLFLFFAYAGTQVAKSTNTQSQTQGAVPTPIAEQVLNSSQLLYISLCFGFSLAVNAWVGLFVPAFQNCLTMEH